MKDIPNVDARVDEATGVVNGDYIVIRPWWSVVPRMNWRRFGLGIYCDFEFPQCMVFLGVVVGPFSLRVTRTNPYGVK